jgi:hypothetical protein
METTDGMDIGKAFHSLGTAERTDRNVRFGLIPAHRNSARPCCYCAVPHSLLTRARPFHHAGLALK